MWDLGIVFAQMLFGLDVYKRYPSPAELIRGSAYIRSATLLLRLTLGVVQSLENRLPSFAESYPTSSSPTRSAASLLHV